MTDENQSPSKARKLIVPIATAIIAIAIIGFVASRAGLDKALVKQKLDDFAAQIHENGAKRGRDIELKYGDLEVVGGLTNKHVVIHDPVLTMKPMDQQPLQPNEAAKPNSLIFTSPTMEIYPESTDLSALRVQFSEPVNVAGMEAPEKSLLKISADVPLALSIAQTTENGVPHMKFHYESPKKINMTYLREQQAEGTEEATPTLVSVYETMHVNFEAGSGLDTNFTADGTELGQGKLNLQKITMAPESAPDAVVNIDSITADWSNTLNEKKQNVLQGKFNIGPVSADPALLPYSPVQITAEATYEGSTPQTAEEVAAGGESTVTAIKLKNFSITTKDASLTATADFNANAGDVLPVGKANVIITNTPYVLTELRDKKILQPEMDKLLTALLVQITGTPVEQLKDVNVAIERDRGGSFKIGQTTFEELFATFLKQAMKPGVVGAPEVEATEPKTGDHAPKLPPKDKPKSQPIAVPDHGVRG